MLELSLKYVKSYLNFFFYFENTHISINYIMYYLYYTLYFHGFSEILFLNGMSSCASEPWYWMFSEFVPKYGTRKNVENIKMSTPCIDYVSIQHELTVIILCFLGNQYGAELAPVRIIEKETRRIIIIKRNKRYSLLWNELRASGVVSWPNPNIENNQRVSLKSKNHTFCYRLP